MRKLFQLVILGILIQIIAMLSFIGIAKTTLAVPGKLIIIILFIVAMIALFVVAVKSLSKKEQLLIAILLTIAFVSVYQIIGFAFFPGLVKGLVPLSFEYFVGFEIASLLGYKNTTQIVNSVSKNNQLIFREFPGVKLPALDPRTILITHDGVVEILIKTRKRLTPDVLHILKKFQIDTTNKKPQVTSAFLYMVMSWVCKSCITFFTNVDNF